MLLGVGDLRARKALSGGCRHLEAREYERVCAKSIAAVHFVMRGAEKRAKGASWDLFRKLTPTALVPFSDKPIEAWPRGTTVNEDEAVFCLDFAIEVCRG